MSYSRHSTICISICLFLLCGCNGDVGGDSKINDALNYVPDTTPPEILVDAMGLEGTLSEHAAVTVNGVTDQDGSVDAVFSVEVNMSTHGLPADPSVGSSALGTLSMSATDAAGNTGGQDVDFSLNN